MGKNEKNWEQILIKIIKELPNVDSRIKQVTETDESLVIKTEVGEVILCISDTEKTS